MKHTYSRLTADYTSLYKLNYRMWSTYVFGFVVSVLELNLFSEFSEGGVREGSM